MQDIRSFLANLRRLGFDIAIAEQIEAHKLLKIAETPMELKYGLRMLICQSKEQQQMFDFIWDGIYSESVLMEELPEMDNDTTIAQGMGIDGGEDFGLAMAKFDSPYKGIARQLLQGNDRNAAAMMMRFIFANRDPEVREEILSDLREMIEPFDTPEDVIARLDRELQQIMQEYLENDSMPRNPLAIQDITDQPLITLQQSPKLNHALKVLGRKLATKQRRRKKGQQVINFRKTIRANIQHGGMMLDLQQMSKRVEKPSLLLMTDVSSSTLQATRLFLTIIWHAREVFSDIRYFEFIGSCIEVTPEFKRAKSVQTAMNSSLAKWRRIIGGKENSDYYSAFKMFERLATESLSNRATVIVLGDMRDWLGPWKNGKPMSADILKRINGKVRRFIVLNPERKRLWDTGDSICKYCSAHGVEIYETTTLGELIKVLLYII